MGEFEEYATAEGAAAALWPIAAPYLRALKDMGLSDQQIARYFRVTPAKVAELARSYAVEGAQEARKRA